jgi:hypothetical protein
VRFDGREQVDEKLTGCPSRQPRNLVDQTLGAELRAALVPRFE